MKILAVSFGMLCAAFLAVQTAYTGLQVQEKFHYWRHRDDSSSGITLISSGTTSGGVFTPLPPKLVEQAYAPTIAIPAPKDHPPLTFISGAHIWTIRYVTDEYLHANNCGGFTTFSTRTVSLGRNESARDSRNTLVHELMHVALDKDPLWHLGITDQVRNDEDSYIGPMAPALRQILADNPALARWILQ